MPPRAAAASSTKAAISPGHARVRRPGEGSPPETPDRLGFLEGAAAAFPVGEGDVGALGGQRADEGAP